MKFKIIASIVVIVVVLIAIVLGTAIRNSTNAGYDQTEQYQQ